jgi:hypothetical protein
MDIFFGKKLGKRIAFRILGNERHSGCYKVDNKLSNSKKYILDSVIRIAEGVGPSAK